MPLFGKNIQITLAPDRAAYLPGDQVVPKVVATFGSDAEVTAAQVRLIGREHLEHVVGLEPIRAGEAKYGKKGHVPAGTRWEQSPRLRLPADAPASGAGPLAVVEWRIAATIELARGRDVQAECPIRVLSPKHRPGASLDQSPFGTLGDCLMDLVIQDRNVGAGETVKATLRIRPFHDLRATSVEAYLILEEVAHTYSSVGPEVTELGRTRLAQGIQVSAGQVAEFPIKIPLAYDLVPSRLGRYSEASWKLMATARRRIVHDLWVAAFLNVYNENLATDRPRPPATSATGRRRRR